MCEHIYDRFVPSFAVVPVVKTHVDLSSVYRIGCAFNAPASYSTINGTFQSCQGDDQLPPGIYVENGVSKSTL